MPVSWCQSSALTDAAWTRTSTRRPRARAARPPRAPARRAGRSAVAACPHGRRSGSMMYAVIAVASYYTVSCGVSRTYEGKTLSMAARRRARSPQPRARPAERRSPRRRGRHRVADHAQARPGARGRGDVALPPRRQQGRRRSTALSIASSRDRAAPGRPDWKAACLGTAIAAQRSCAGIRGPRRVFETTVTGAPRACGSSRGWSAQPPRAPASPMPDLDDHAYHALDSQAPGFTQ